MDRPAREMHVNEDLDGSQSEKRAAYFQHSDKAMERDREQEGLEHLSSIDYAKRDSPHRDRVMESLLEQLARGYGENAAER